MLTRSLAALATGLVLAACVGGSQRTADAAEAPPARSGAAPAPGAGGKDESPAARVMIAEIALERGDCVEATSNYVAVALQSDDVRLSGRAAAVAMVCGLLGPAGEAVRHWRSIAPNDGEAALAATLLALKLYDLDTARKALTTWRDSGAQNSQEPGEFADLLEHESDATAALAVFGDVLADEDATAEVLLAKAQLALRAYNIDVASKAAKSVLALDGDNAAASAIIVRGQAVRGDMAAIAGARTLAPKAAGEDKFIVADVLATLDRIDEARAELEKMSADPVTHAGAERRLGSIALDRGDIATAERHFSKLVTEQGTSAIAVLYLAQIAERRGDTSRALQSYALLADGPLASVARTRAAAILMRSGSREQALGLLDSHAKSNPDEAVELAGARADLLADSGDFTAATKDIESSLKRFPEHPSLEYQRATLLERAGKSREAVAALEKILKSRPADPGIANALGYTLADHNRDLPRAGKLIDQALLASPDSPAIQDSKGWVLYRSGKLQDAAKVLELAYRNGRDAEIGAHYGEVLWKLGNQTQARDIWTRALSVDPKNKTVVEVVTRLTGKAPPAPPASPPSKPLDEPAADRGIQKIRYEQ